MADFKEVQYMAQELGFTPEGVNPDEELFHVTKEEDGISNLFVDCEGEIVVLEQPILPVTEKTDYKALMQLNRSLVHGAFAVSDDNWVVWRDTLRLETLDWDEFAGSIHALSLAMAEHADTLLSMH